VNRPVAPEARAKRTRALAALTPRREEAPLARVLIRENMCTGGFSGTVTGNLQFQHIEQLQMLQQFQHLQQQQQQQQKQQQQQQQQQQQLLQQVLQQHAQSLGLHGSLSSPVAQSVQQMQMLPGISTAGAFNLAGAATNARGPLSASAVLASPKTATQGAPASGPAGGLPEASSLPQMDGADEGDSDSGSDDDESEDAGGHGAATGRKESQGSDNGDQQRAPQRATTVAVKVEDWFVEVDESMRGFEEGAMKAQGYVGLASGAVVWVLGNNAWYRLKQPHQAYEPTLQAFVNKVTMGDNVCELVRRSPYASVHKMIDQLVETTLEQQRFQETQETALGNVVQDASRKRPALSKKAAATVAIPLIHDRAEYLSICIERAAKINTRVEKSRLVSGLLQEATDARASRLLRQQCPELSSLALEKARRKGSARAVLGGVWQRYDQEGAEDELGDTQMLGSDRRAEELQTAELLEISKVLCEMVSKVELDVMRARPTGNTRRMLAPVKGAKTQSRTAKGDKAGGAAASKAATAKAARTGNISALFDDSEQSNSYASFSLQANSASAADAGAAQMGQWSKNKKRKDSKVKPEDGEDVARDSRGKTWHDHLITLVSKQVLQEVVLQVDKINSCPQGVSATNPSVAATPVSCCFPTTSCCCMRAACVVCAGVDRCCRLALPWCCLVCHVRSVRCAASLAFEGRQGAE